ncbi:MAG: dTMP kinase [Peptococcales bacterium]|jgi:dTMP kinase
MGGKFITLEGCDGSGKTTQINLLKNKLKEMAIPCLFTREPGGTHISEQVREVILDAANQGMVSQTEALLYGACRAQLVGEVILPALKKGMHVICDRFIDSTLAYQGYGRGLSLEDLEAINNYATGGLKPDLTIVLDINPELTLQRISKRKVDRLEGEKVEFHHRVRNGYLKLAQLEPERFIIIDGHRSIEDVHNEIMHKVLSVFVSDSDQ